MGFCSGICANMKWDSIWVLKDMIWPRWDVLYLYTYPNLHLVEPRYPYKIGWYNQSVTFCLLLLHLATSVTCNNFLQFMQVCNSLCKIRWFTATLWWKRCNQCGMKLSAIIRCNSTEEAIVFLFWIRIVSGQSRNMTMMNSDCCESVYLSWKIGTYYMLFMFVQPLDSAYGLSKHRDGRWEWEVTPGISPSPRYQHAAVRLIASSSIY